MDMSGPVAIFLFFLLLLVDMFFYGFDAAIDNLNEKEILHKAEEEKDRRSMRLSEMISRPGIYINTVQLVITLINILMGAFYLNIWLQTIDKGLHVINVGGMSLENVPTGVLSGIATVLSFIAMIYILLTFGVLIPRKMASRQPEKWAYACIDPIYIITRLLAPLTGLVNLTAKGILFLFGVRNNTDENDVTEEEIINMVQEGHEQGVIQASEAEMISNIFEYGDKEAQDIMTHRGSIVAIDGETKLKDAIASMLGGKNSRYPVYEENIDHIIGILHLKDAMRFHISDDKLDLPIAKLDGLLREPYFVPQQHLLMVWTMKKNRRSWYTTLVAVPLMYLSSRSVTVSSKYWLPTVIHTLAVMILITRLSSGCFPSSRRQRASTCPAIRSQCSVCARLPRRRRSSCPALPPRTSICLTSPQMQPARSTST